MLEFLDFFSTIPIQFLDWSVEFLQNVPWYIILIFGFLLTFIENIFPPAPCDTIIVFMGSLVSLSIVGFIPLLLFTSAGSLVGFIVMFWLGLKFGVKIVETNKISFINKKNMEKPEKWFREYGYSLIVVNRFLAGTRAVIAFFAGMSKMDLKKSSILSFVSAMLWNGILIGLGYVFAENLDLVKKYISLYGKIAFPIILLILILLFLRWNFRKRKRNKLEGDKDEL